jgi:uncharacterized protein
MDQETRPASEQHALPLSIILHLLPGILTGGAFFLLAPLIQKLNFPPFMAQCLANVLVLLPLIFGFLFYQGYKKNGRLSLNGVVLYREKIRGWEYLLWVPLVILATALIAKPLSFINDSIYQAFFSWWPAAYNLTADLGAYSRSTLIVSYIVNFLVISLAAPITEEIYFRGYLLPRLSRFGWRTIPIHTVLFALFHVWSPWMAVVRALELIPLTFVAQKKRNIYIGMIVHIFVNALDVVTGVTFIINHF